MGVSAQGMKFMWQNSTTKPTTASTSRSIGEMNSVSGPTGSAGIIDVTHLNSVAKEKMMGLPDEGQISLETNFAYSTEANAIQKALAVDRAARTRRAWGILFPDTSSSLAVGDGYCTGFSVSGSVDNKMTLAVTIEIDGAITWTT